MDLPTIAARLGVEHVVEGSVQQSGSELRINARLIEVATESTLWFETYRPGFTNIFDVQDEIAARVAGALQVRLLGSEVSLTDGRRTANVEAHDAYLFGLHHLRTQRSEDIARARAYFERAIELDDEYAAAYAGLAFAFMNARIYGLMPPQDAIAGVERAAARALELDPLLADAYIARGYVAEDVEMAERDYRRAIELSPNSARAYNSLASILGAQNRPLEGRAALAKAVELDPLDAVLNWLMGSSLLALGDFDGARSYQRRAIEIEPTSPNAYAGLADVAIVTGRLDEAMRSALAALEQDSGHPHITTTVGLIYLSLDDRASAEPWLARGADLLQAPSLSSLLRDFVPLVVRREDPGRLLSLLRDIPPVHMGAFSSRLFRKMALATGDLGGIRAFYEQYWPELFGAEPVVDINNFTVATDVAWLLKNEGATNRAESLLNQSLAIYRDPVQRPMFPSEWDTVTVQVEAYALLGREDEALDALRSQIDNGWRWCWWQLETDPTLASIRNRPEFEAMMDEVGADVALQLERVREMQRSGVIVLPADAG